MGKIRTASLLLVTGLLGLAGCAGTPDRPAAAGDEKPADGNRCLFVRNINNFQVLDDRTLIVWAPGRRNPYKIELMSICQNLRFANSIAFNTQGVLCGYARERLIFSDMGKKTLCSVSDVSRLSAQQMNTLLVKHGQKPSCITEEEKATTQCAGRESGEAEETGTEE